MKQRFFLILAGLFLLIVQAKAQVPFIFNYQGVARDASGAILPNRLIGLEFTIRQGTASGTIVYQETQADSTNLFGLFTAAIGRGAVVTGTIAGVGWGTNGEYLEVGMDPTGGTNYTNMGAQQLLSVPYALFASNSGNTSATAWQLTGNDVGYSFSSTPATYLGTSSSGGGGFQFGINGNNAGRVEVNTGNTAIGYLSLNSSGTQSTAVGYGALHANTAVSNTAVGYVASYSNVNGTDIVAIGDSAFYDNNTGEGVAVGASALKANTGADNVAIGYKSLVANTTGTNNTALGYKSNVASGSLTNATAIGANAVVGESNAVVLGSTGINAVNVGIGTTTPNSSLQISVGNLSLPITVSATSVNLSSSPNTYSVIITATGQTVTLPAASSCTGRVYIIVAQMGSGSITISSFKNFSGAATTSVAAGNSIMLQSDGTNWDEMMYY